MKYGIPYMGSKSKIADAIISALPAGKRFVDLFGGGFAMSHCALLSNKYERVLYNEINPLLPDLVRRAIKGDISYEWVSREEFHRRKDTDGLVKYLWSFGNNGVDYLFGEDIEDIKRAGHEYVVHGTPIKGITFPTQTSLIPSSYKDRRRELQQASIYELKRCQALERLEQLQRLERLEQLQRLEIKCGSYTEYQYQDGDVVYCDPPYADTRGYNGVVSDFDNGAFFDWVASRDYVVYMSHYPLNDDRFYKFWSIPKLQTISHRSRSFREECIYVQLSFAEMA